MFPGIIMSRLRRVEKARIAPNALLGCSKKSWRVGGRASASVGRVSMHLDNGLWVKTLMHFMRDVLMMEFG